jgi:hypothetical protein
MRILTRAGVVITAALIALATSSASAMADPHDNLCGFNLLCRMMPIAPDLDGNIDLTKEQPQALPDDPTTPPVGSLPPVGSCTSSCP